MLEPNSVTTGASLTPPSIPETVRERVDLIRTLTQSDNFDSGSYPRRLAWMSQNIDRLLAPPVEGDSPASELIRVLVASVRAPTFVAFTNGNLDRSFSPLLQRLELSCREHLHSFSASELSRLVERRFPTGRVDASLPTDLCKTFEQKASLHEMIIACCSLHGRGETPSPIALELFRAIAPRLHECSNQQIRRVIAMLRRGYLTDTPQVTTCVEILKPHLHNLSATQAFMLLKGTRKSSQIDQRIADCFEEHLLARGQSHPPLTRPPPQQSPPVSSSQSLHVDKQEQQVLDGYLTHDELSLLAELANKVFQSTTPHAELCAKALRALQHGAAYNDPREVVNWGTLVARCYPQFREDYERELPSHREILRSLPFPSLASAAHALRSLPKPDREPPLRVLAQVLMEKFGESPLYPVDWVAPLLPFAEGVSESARAALEAPLRDRLDTAGRTKQLQLVTQILRWPHGPTWARALVEETLDKRLNEASPAKLRTIATKFSWLCSEFPDIKSRLVPILRNNLASRPPESAMQFRAALREAGFRANLLTVEHLRASATTILSTSPSDSELIPTFFLELRNLSGDALQTTCRHISNLAKTTDLLTTLLATSAMQRLGYHDRAELRPLYLTFENQCISAIVNELENFKSAMPTLPDHAFARVIRIMGLKGYRDLALCDDIIRETVKRAHRLEPKVLASIADALGRLRIENIEFWSCFAEHASKHWDAYKADRLSSASIWALAVYAPHLVPSVCTPAQTDGIEKNSTWLKVYHALLLSGQVPPTSYPPRYHELMRDFTFSESSPSEAQFGVTFPRTLQVPLSRIQSKVVVGGFETDWVVDLTSRRLIIELDGEIHFLCGPDGKGLLNGRDILQDKIFQIFGYETFHFPASALRNPVETAQSMHELAIAMNRIRKQYPPNGARRVYLQ